MSGLFVSAESSHNLYNHKASPYDIENAEKTCLLANCRSYDVPGKDKLSSYPKRDPIELTDANKKYLTTIRVSSFVLLFLSVIQAALSLFVLYQWPELRILKIITLFLGIFSGSFAFVCISAIRGANENNFSNNSHLAFDSLSFFFNMSILFSIIFLGFSVCLFTSSIFWSAEMLNYLFYVDHAVFHIRLALFAFVILSFALFLISVLCMVACILIRRNDFSPVVNEQTFLWLTLVSGICGSLMLSISIYTTTFVHPFTGIMQSTIRTLGITLLIMSILSLIRFTLLLPQNKIPIRMPNERNTQKSKIMKFWIGRIHVIILISLAFVAALLAISLLQNGDQIKPKDIQIQSMAKMQEMMSIPVINNNVQLTRAEEEKRIIEKEVIGKQEQERMWDIFMKKMQYSILGSFMLVVSLYTLADGVISSKIQRIHDSCNL